MIQWRRQRSWDWTYVSLTPESGLCTPVITRALLGPPVVLGCQGANPRPERGAGRRGGEGGLERAGETQAEERVQGSTLCVRSPVGKGRGSPARGGPSVHESLMLRLLLRQSRGVCCPGRSHGFLPSLLPEFPFFFFILKYSCSVV